MCVVCVCVSLCGLAKSLSQISLQLYQRTRSQRNLKSLQVLCVCVYARVLYLAYFSWAELPNSDTRCQRR